MIAPKWKEERISDAWNAIPRIVRLIPTSGHFRHRSGFLFEIGFPIRYE